MWRILVLALGALAAAVVVITAIDLQRAPPPERGGETKDRLSEIELDRLVERPGRQVARGDVAAGKAEFERELAYQRQRKGEASLQAADMLSAFGLKLREHGYERESIPYFRRAVQAYRAAAPDSPELALALHDYALALYEDNKTNPSPEAIDAMRESLRIRRATLGMENGETGVSYVFLGELKGLPANTRGEARLIDEAAAHIRTGMEILERARNAEGGDIHGARQRLLTLYATNGRGDDTIRTVARYAFGDDAFPPGMINDLADQLEKAGDRAAAARLREEYGEVED